MPEDPHEKLIRIRKAMLAAIAVIAVATACVFLFRSTLRPYAQATAVLFETESSQVPLFLEPLADHPVRISNVTVPVKGARPLRALLYKPGDIVHPPAIVIIHGVHRLGYEEPRLVALASALARCGFQVLTPEMPALIEYDITPAAVQRIGASVDYLSRISGQKVGLIGISFAGGLALMAAADPAVQPHIKAVLSIGGHDSFARVAEYYIAGQAAGADGSTFNQPPHSYGPLILAYEHLGDYVPADDVTPISNVLKAHLYENASGEAQLVSQLNSRQASEWKMLEDNNAPDEIARAKKSSKEHAAEMNAVSPAGHLSSLHVPVFLLHGAGDTVIPPTELSYLEKDIPSDDLKDVLVTPVMSHVSFYRSDVSFADRCGMIKFLAQFLKTASS